MWLIFYVKDGVKGWFLGETEEELQEWADDNLDTSSMSGEDEYEIVDLANRDLTRKVMLANDKLLRIKEILKEK